MQLIKIKHTRNFKYPLEKKGFTLIELLAVIIILAVIALIATPIIMNAIHNAKRGAFKDSAYGIIKAGELYYASNIKDGNSFKGETIDLAIDTKLNYKGTKPKKGSLIIDANGNISLEMSNDDFTAKKDFNESEVTITNREEQIDVDQKAKFTIYAYGGSGGSLTAKGPITWGPLDDYMETLNYDKIAETFENSNIAVTIKDNEILTDKNIIVEDDITDIDNQELHPKHNISRFQIPGKGYVLINYNCYNSEQKAGEAYPMPVCINYELAINENGEKWLPYECYGSPQFGADYGDQEYALIYVTQPGYIETSLRPVKYVGEPISRFKQPIYLDVKFIKEDQFPSDVKK